MSRAVSPSAQRPYGVARLVRTWCLARSSSYLARRNRTHPRLPGKRGPKVLSVDELLAEIGRLLAAPIFSAEAYRKIWARLRHQGTRTAKDRVLRQHQLSSPARRTDAPPSLT